MMKGVALNAIGRHDEAIEYCRQACRFHAAGFLPPTHLAGALAEAEQKCEARTAVENALQLQSALSIGFLRDQFTPMNESVLKTVLDSLRKAGVPE